LRYSGLSHVAFQVRDLDRSLHFYCEQLGMRESFRLTFGNLLRWREEEARAGRVGDDDARSLDYMRAHADGPWLVYLEAAPGQYLELFPAIHPDDLRAPPSADSHAHMCLLVDDAEEAAASLRRQGLEPEGSITRGPDNSLQLWLTDPDGHRIEFMQYTATSVQVAGRPR
jgi:catechol 2,3-dioxygenase-like lactoylglutathione lyase family enzyme